MNEFRDLVASALRDHDGDTFEVDLGYAVDDQRLEKIVAAFREEGCTVEPLADRPGVLRVSRCHGG